MHLNAVNSAINQMMSFGVGGGGAPSPPIGALTEDDGTTLLYEDDGTTILTED